MAFLRRPQADGLRPRRLMNWADTIVSTLRRSSVELVTYVPDQVLAPLEERFKADPAVTCFTATREDEAIGIACGAALAGGRAVAMMQSSGFGNVPNALASLATPYQIPVLLIISERGVLGEFNPVQSPIVRVLRSTFDGLGIPHATLARRDEVEFLVSRMSAQCFNTNQPAALILSPMLTGGKTAPVPAAAD